MMAAGFDAAVVEEVDRRGNDTREIAHVRAQCNAMATEKWVT